MSHSPDRLIPIELWVNASQSRLLDGLEDWLTLRLISDAQVLQLSQTYLTCPLPEPAIQPSSTTPDEVSPAQPVLAGRFVQSPEPQTRPRWPRLDRSKSGDRRWNWSEWHPSAAWMAQLFQSLMAELSVVWLLCIGVFLVIVSSAVLAATQWERFDTLGQYGILAAYTLALWGSGQWAKRQAHLQLTSLTLQTVSLLLVPINVWAIDQLNLWQSGLGFGVAIAVIGLLSGLVVRERQLLNANWFQQLSFLSLCWLQGGWELLGMPTVAVYVGVVGSAIALVYGTQTAIRRAEHPPLNRAALLVLYGVAVLLLRVMLDQGLAIAPFGLALGLAGWTLAWLAQQSLGQEDRGDAASSPRPPSDWLRRWWLRLGMAVLLLAWIVSVIEVPVQALAVSGLALYLVGRQLRQDWRRRDLALLFAIGFQAVWLAWRLMPLAGRQTLVDQAVQLTGTALVPDALLGLVFLPYLAFMVGVTGRLNARHPQLARFGERLAVALGLLLMAISAFNLTTWSINLWVSVGLLGIVTQRQPRPRWLWIAATQLCGLAGIGAAIALIWPDLALPFWALTALGLAIAEWIFSLGRDQSEWRQSAWWFGLGLAGLSYGFLWLHHVETQWAADTATWGLLWLGAPLALSVLSAIASPSRRYRWARVSSLGLGLALLLIWPTPTTRLIGLMAATLLMGVNTYWLATRWAAVATWGFTLAGISVLLADGWLGFSPNSWAAWELVGAIALSGLWLGWRVSPAWTQGVWGQQIQLYRQAADQWAISLCGGLLIALSLESIWLYWMDFQGTPLAMGAIALLIGALGIRTWQHPTPLAVWALGWGVELLVADGVRLGGGEQLELAIANAGLALLTLLLNWIWRSRASRWAQSLTFLPLAYALLGVLLRLDALTSWTGGLTLAAAITGLEMGRQTQQRWLKCLSLLCLSLGWYELVLYPLLQAEGGQPADGLIVLAGVAGVILMVYRLAERWAARRLALPPSDLRALAQLHWTLATILLAWSAIMLASSGASLGGWAIALGVVLTGYAADQGRLGGADLPEVESSTSFATWIYISVAEFVGVVLYARLLWSSLERLDPWWSLLACGMAIALYLAPWDRWGWVPEPWQRCAQGLPIGVAIATGWVVHSVSLVGIAGFYLWLAQRDRQIRWTYLSLFLMDWLLWRWLIQADINDLVAYVFPVGISLFYWAQVDPGLKPASQRENRHYLRLVGVGLIYLTAFLSDRWTGLPLGLLSLVTLFGGLTLQIRALLYVGTLAFLLNAFNQLVLLNQLYPFTKWVLGILVGSALIWLAASFETRRGQVMTLMRDWTHELENWE